MPPAVAAAARATGPPQQRPVEIERVPLEAIAGYLGGATGWGLCNTANHREMRRGTPQISDRPPQLTSRLSV